MAEEDEQNHDAGDDHERQAKQRVQIDAQVGDEIRECLGAPLKLPWDEVSEQAIKQEDAEDGDEAEPGSAP